jgi:hypothetical protein
VVLIDRAIRYKKAVGVITDIMPKTQVQESQFPLQISYFLQNCKKGKAQK